MKIKNLFLIYALFFSLKSFGLPISVEIVRSTSDALSVSLEAELKQRISHSQDFVLSRGAKSELELLIAQPPKVRKLSNNTQVSYTVNFVTQQSVLSASSGSCWQDQISECAEQILRDAKLNLRPN